MICLQAFDSAMTSDRKVASIESAIYLLRGRRVMLDSDLAAIYGTSTMRLNGQFKRNRKRFPDDNTFVLTREEFTNLISQAAISRSHGGRRTLPIAFTEHGANMFGRARSPSAPQRTARRSVPTIKRQEIGLHVRERSGRYQAKRRF
jgi:hypothetical protein